MTKLILIAALSFGLGGMVVRIYDQPKISAFDQMMLTEQQRSEQTQQELQKALSGSKMFPGAPGRKKN